MKENIVAVKSMLFALEIMALCKRLKAKKEYELASQILRAGTSIGTNIAESVDAQSAKDFLNKISIALKEARETKYWFDLLVKSETYTISELKCTGLLEEIISILTKIKKTLKTNYNL
jgi:four helix bundle protein